MPLVSVREDESFESALRRFKRKRKAVQARKKMLRKMAEERRLGLR